MVRFRAFIRDRVGFGMYFESGVATSHPGHPIGDIYYAIAPKVMLLRCTLISLRESVSVRPPAVGLSVRASVASMFKYHF